MSFHTHKNMYIYHRDETRGQKMVKAMRDVGFDLKMQIKKVNLNDQILVVNSSLIGDTAKDIHSFTQTLLRYFHLHNYPKESPRIQHYPKEGKIIYFAIARETEKGPVKIPQLLLLRCQLSGGWDTDLRSVQLRHPFRETRSMPMDDA